MISLCKAMGGSWYPYKETAVSMYGNFGIHTWTLSFPALENLRFPLELISYLETDFACLDESKVISSYIILLSYLKLP